MSASLLVTERIVNGVVILHLAGRFVFEEGDEVFRERVAALVAGGHRAILVDLREVTNIDSGGVGSLAAMQLHTLKRRCRLKLLAPGERVLRVLHITHLESVFEIFTDEAAALRSFASNRVVA